MNELVVRDKDLSKVWLKAVRCVNDNHGELAPLVVCVDGLESGTPLETPEIRSELDNLLATQGLQSCEKVASTIFPRSMWNPSRDRHELFSRYLRILPRIKKRDKRNRRGTYFERLITGGRADAFEGNQLEFVLSSYAKGIKRRSLLQATVFDPKKDHIAAPRLGFPCLQQVAFTRIKEAGECKLSVTAFYATQSMIERAYGNYLGLCSLGAFIAHELEMPLARMTCVTGLASVDVPRNRLGTLLGLVERVG